MGGLHSGRVRRHTCIDDCLNIDTAWLRKHRLLPGQQPQRDQSQACSITWRKWTEQNFIERKEQRYQISAALDPETPALVLSYQVELQGAYGRKKRQNHTHLARLVSTACQYGNVRWWFACPACSRRVRVLYINPKSNNLQGMRPLCRLCADLHYPSQMASYIERHKTYERHLLANYGLYWAAHRYDYELKEHYLEMTPELWALRLRSVIDWNVHLLQLIVRCDLAIYRSDLANLKSLRTEEDRRLYLAHMQEKEQELNTGGVIRTLCLCIEYERLISQVNTRDMPEELFELYARLAEIGEEAREHKAERAPASAVETVEQVEQKIISLEAILKQVNQARRKKAA